MVFDIPQVVDCSMLNLLQLYSQVDATGNMMLSEKLVLGGT